jgi:hypothetical protein
MGPLTNHDESESGLSNTLPGHRAGSPSLLTLLGPDPKTAAGFTGLPHARTSAGPLCAVMYCKTTNGTLAPRRPTTPGLHLRHCHPIPIVTIVFTAVFGRLLRKALSAFDG